MTLAQLGPTRRWVDAEIAGCRQPGPVDVAQVAVHPTHDLVACTLTGHRGGGGDPHREVAVVRLDSGDRLPAPAALTAAHSPRWSPDGASLCVLAADGTGVTGVRVYDPLRAEPTVRACTPPGEVEAVRWSPSGARIAMLVADPGAQISDVYGSGTLPDPDGGPSWQPTVSPSARGRRSITVWDLRTGTCRRIATPLNVWDLDWCGDDELLALASPGAGEGAWYGAELVTVDLHGATRVLHEPARQLAQPTGAPDGRGYSVLSAPASDRGLLAGEILVATLGGAPRRLDTPDVDVTDHRWLDEHRILFAGTRRGAAVYGLVDVAGGGARLLPAAGLSSGQHQPELGGLTARGELVLAGERHDRPPALLVVTDGVARTVLDTAGAGTAYAVSRAGSTRSVTWTSSDGRPVQGWLTVPDGDGPHPLVVHVHGGPVASWHDGWLGRDPHTLVLVARGYAVLRPNPRGSTGRGAEYVEAVIGDMGGLDVDDLVAGVAHLADLGLVDPRRAGISGNSYGGFMAAWVPCVSDVFAAAVARSPVTDWRTQHFTSNLAEFDAMFLGGDPLDPGSRYATRSPLPHADRIRTPMLLTAGARDLATPASQAQLLHQALLERGVDTHLAVYPREGHGVRQPEAVSDQIARALCWFDRYLRPGR